MFQESPNGGPKRIVVSGINGYIAMALGLEILRAGHILVGTSRSSQHEVALRSGAYAPFASRFEHICIADMTVPGAFDTALKGAHAFLHLASPVVSSQSYETSIAPTVQSAMSAIKSAAAAGPQFDSLIYMSSIVAAIDQHRIKENPCYAFSEEDWNEGAVQRVKEAELSGEGLPWMAWYSASKVAAEKAIFEYRKDQRPSFGVSTVLPAFVYGPPILNGTDGSELKLSVSLQTIHALCVKGDTALEGEGSGYPEPYVDLRDVVSLCMWLINNKEKGDGQRYLAAAGSASARDIWEVIQERASRGNSDQGKAADSGVLDSKFWWKDNELSLKSTKMESALGIKLRGLEQSVGDTCEAFWQHGIKSEWRK